MKTITANGFQTIDGALYQSSVPTSQLDSVVTMKENRHLALLPAILPAGTQIYVPKFREQIKKMISLWD